jgi:uncharacterized protein YdcH (DUF465 family)
MDEQTIKTRLLAENDEFRNVHEQHQKYEQELDRYKNKSFLTDEESMRMKEIKLKKLSLKDRMYAMMADFRKSFS